MSETLATLVRLLPVASLVAVGWVLARRGIIAGAVSKPLCDLAFIVLIPCYLVPALYASDLRRLFDLPAIGSYGLAALLGMAVVGLVSVYVTRLGPSSTALRMMAACQVNTAYFAIPVFVQLFGDAAPIFPVLLLQVCVLTVIVLTVLEFGRTAVEPGDHHLRTIARALFAALTTPVVLACAVGIGANVLRVPIPDTALDGLAVAGNAASPVALIALGLHLGGTTLRWRGAPADENAIIVFKCVVMPLLVYAIAKFVVGVHTPWLAYLTVLAAMPTPQNVFILAGRYDVDIDFAGSTVVKTTLLALLLLPVWTLWLRV